MNQMLPPQKENFVSLDPVDQHIGARLRAFRLQRNLSLQAVGQGLGVTYQQIRKYESGSNRVSASTLYRLAEFFGVEPCAFFEGLPGVGPSDTEWEGDPSMRAVLTRIPDPDLRHHLAALLRALEQSADSSEPAER